MNKFGLKLWSENTNDYLFEAVRLFENEVYDYIELYIVPDSLEKLKSWKTVRKNHKIPFTLHAPHFIHGINLALKDYEKENLRVFEQVRQVQDELEAEYVVVHGGMEGDIKETVRQFKLLNLKNPLIENKPYRAPKKPDLCCRGAVIEEIKYVIDETGCGFCLDIGHAFCTANSFKLNPYKYLEEFNKFNPQCYHLSGNYIENEIDLHLHLYEGNLDIKRIFDIIDLNKNIAIETRKDSTKNLNDFVEDVKCLKSLK